MANSSSRRSFLAAGLALPAAGILEQSKTAAPATGMSAAVQANKKPLRFRQLGKTGLKVTELGHGCEAVSDVSVLERAIDFGINFFDTARSYQAGNNERVLAAALKGRRKGVIVSTRSYTDAPKRFAEELDTSLQELKTDYVDIWYIGAKDKPELVENKLEAQYQAQKAGKIRFRGLSTHAPAAMADFILNEGKFDVIQVPYNFAIGTQRDPYKYNAVGFEDAIKKFHAAGIGVVAMKVMAGGYRGPTAPPDRNADIHQRTGAHAAALRWALRGPWVHTTSVRMQDVEQLEENLQAMAAPFSPADEKLLALQLDLIRPVYCRMCRTCEGQCPSGLPVSDMIRFVTYADGYGQFQMGHSRFSQLPEEVRAVRCADCSRCQIECPNGVAVRQQLIRAQELFA